MSARLTRRAALRAGAAVATVSLAGCGGDGGGGGPGGGDGGGGAIELEPGAQIELDGITAGWEGLAPSAIEGSTNPTLSLVEGETYEIGWTQGDGANHNIAIYDDSDAVVDDLQTEIVAEPGDDQWLEFDASSEMTTYICEVHPTTMVGDIELRSG
ncbi:blue (type 1) copper domain-containing protein [Halovivax asiaticus JCM 14624]|uniref:Blue (Type 1) copper domain-containing protein n=1 Tax=Halovivax asiaticus JCM 14624 TaxID=1227490 RepID=M0BJR4_9EURY|nr:plastocyanin/azurin family copper-binding protein [Halovivax asiaticus]ELZ10722.1 blue (type 1) copper domain-containing protein [Halovivax asiaticus JCM 14624]